jgi:hypothetical protein
MPVLLRRRNVAVVSRRIQVLFRVTAFHSREARRRAAGAAAVGAVLAVVSCSSPTVPAASGGPRASASPADSRAASAAASPAGTALTGTQLRSALASPTSFPGFSEDTQDAYQGGTGTAVLSPRDNLATMSCTSFSKQMLYATGFGQTAIAWRHFERPTADQWTQTYDEFIYQFADASTAGSFIQALRSAFNRCRSYNDIESGVAIQTTYSVADIAPLGGGQAMQVTVTAAATPGTAAGTLLYVLGGNEVYGVVRAGEVNAVPASPSESAIIQGMMTQVHAMTN